MELLRTIGLMLLALSILIVIHELGHYWAARMFKIRVERFFLFFDYKFKLFSLKKGETEYGVGWIPLGGYVKIAGMLDESMDGQAAVGPAQPWEFRSKPIWQRLIVMLGGIIMNVILGCVIFIGLKFLVGDRVTPMDKLEFGIVVDENSVLHPLGFRTGDKILSYNGKSYPSLEDYSNPSKLVDSEKVFEVRHADGRIEKISLPDSIMGRFQDSGEPALFMPDMPPILYVLEYDGKKVTDAMARNPQMDTAGVSWQAWRAGIRKGDRVISVDSAPVERWSQFQSIVRGRPGETMTITVDRKGKVIPFTVTSKPVKAKDKITGKIGVLADIDTLRTHFRYSPGEAIPMGIAAAFTEVSNNVKGLKALVTGRVNPAKSMAGPIGIAKIYGSAFDLGGWTSFWRLTGMLSMVLAVMNLLPIPVLDGGHVLILIVEGIIGREIPIKAKTVIMYIGFFMVLALMAFVILNDLIKLF
jgi:regulator of sigma E protease